MTAQDVARCGRDDAGYAAIGSYGVIGDGRGVALVAEDGSIDWWAAPRLDSTPPFAALLDPDHGGRIELRPTEDVLAFARRYVLHTNVLETTFTTASGRVQITDSLNSGNAGALPWSELARRVDGLDGTVELSLVVQPGTGLGAWSPWVESDERGHILHAGPLTMAVRASAGIAVSATDRVVTATFGVRAGDRLIVGVLASDRAPLFLADPAAIDERVDLSVASWRHWSTQVSWTGQRREQIVRSALALKLLMIAQTGAIAAAATTSLPERVGGTKNWDYRFAWIRDAALTIGAMDTCGLQEEVHAAIQWLLRTISANGPRARVMYTLDGDIAPPAQSAPVPGYRASSPVLTGNDATEQTQIGVYGDLLGVVAAWVFQGHVLDVGTARQLAEFADRCADIWRTDDAGIWELEDQRSYTVSKMNCWRAMDRAAALAEAGHIAGSGARWRAEAEHIRAYINEHCWSQSKHAYTMYANTQDLDAAVLLAGPWGFGEPERMNSTIDAIRAELARGPLLYRYTGAANEEEAFLACSYWLVQALVVVDRHEEAERLMADLDRYANPVGLLPEMVDPATGELMGNIPQALSHLTLINAAAMLRDSTIERPRRAN